MKALCIAFFAATSLICSTQAYAVMYLARPYEPNMARWLTRDPIGEDGGPNLYGFVGNDPIHRIDALGFEGSAIPGIPHVSNDRHNNYLIFQISCPARYKAQNVSVVYDNANMLAEMYQWYANSVIMPGPIITLNSYSSSIMAGLDGTFGGIQDPGRPNCKGDPIEVHAYMRTRLVAPAWYFGAWRSSFGAPDPNTMIGIYQENTRIFWVCTDCCGRGLTIR